MPEFNQTESGAMREAIGTKIDTTLVPYELIVAVAIGLNYGREKYGARNYEKGLSYSALTGSIERHNKAIMDGEFFDAPSGLPHYTLLASSVAMLCNNIMQGTIIQDRPPEKCGRPVGELAEFAEVIFKDCNLFTTPLTAATPGTRQARPERG